MGGGQDPACIHMGGCQHYGPFLDPYYNTAPNISGTQKGAIILTTTDMSPSLGQLDSWGRSVGSFCMAPSRFMVGGLYEPWTTIGILGI